MFDDLVTYRDPPPNRVSGCGGSQEQHFSEGAVMLSFAMHLLGTVPGLNQVAIHPDGEHGKRFDFRGWLEKRGFVMCAPKGSTTYGGSYSSPENKTVIVEPKSGQGDVVAEIGGTSFVAECKGGVINTTHPGQQSRLRQGLCETVGLSLAVPLIEGRHQYVVAPLTKTTETLAKRMAARALRAGIRIALVDARGNVHEVDPPENSTVLP